MNDTIKILIVDDHAVVREGLKAILHRHSRYQVVGEAGNGRKAIQIADKLELMSIVV